MFHYYLVISLVEQIYVLELQQFHSFVDGKNKIMTLLVAESGILLIYEETTLRWSAKLPFIPVAITKADLKVNIKQIVLWVIMGELI